MRTDVHDPEILKPPSFGVEGSRPACSATTLEGRAYALQHEMLRTALLDFLNANIHAWNATPIPTADWHGSSAIGHATL